MSKQKYGQPLSVRLRDAASRVDQVAKERAQRNGWIQKETPGAPDSVLMREAADLAQRYEEADTATFRRRKGLVGVVPSVTWEDGQTFRIVPEAD